MLVVGVILLVFNLSSVQSAEDADKIIGVSEEFKMKELRKGTPQSQQQSHKSVEPDTKVRFVVEIVGFSCSIGAFLFWIMLRVCPPICRAQYGQTNRRFEDKQLPTGEIF
jgi:hypothetical protein